MVNILAKNAYFFPPPSSQGPYFFPIFAAPHDTNMSRMLPYLLLPFVWLCEAPHASLGRTSPPVLLLPGTKLRAAADSLFSEIMEMIELELARLWDVYPGSCGSSGIFLKTQSRAFLNVSTSQPVMFRICCGSILKSLAPLIGRLASCKLPILLFWTLGTLHLRPRRAWKVLVIFPFMFGTKPSRTF